LLKNLLFEFRLGYAREIDLDTSRINIKPMLIYFNRLGDAKIYVNKNSASKTSLYLDLLRCYAIINSRTLYADYFAGSPEIQSEDIHIENYLIQYDSSIAADYTIT
jgi:hypothetical protein